MKSTLIFFTAFLFVLNADASFCQSPKAMAHGKIIRLPTKDKSLSSEVLIKKYITKKFYNKNYFISSGDTTIVGVFSYKNLGIYYFGSNRTNHSPSSYKIVYRYKEHLQYFSNSTSLKEQQLVCNHFFEINKFSGGGKSKKIAFEKIRTLLLKNKKKVDSDVF